MPLGPRPAPTSQTVGRYSRFCESEAAGDMDSQCAPELYRKGGSKLFGPRPMVQSANLSPQQRETPSVDLKRSDSSQSSFFSETRTDSVSSAESMDGSTLKAQKSRYTALSHDLPTIPSYSHVDDVDSVTQGPSSESVDATTPSAEAHSELKSKPNEPEVSQNNTQLPKLPPSGAVTDLSKLLSKLAIPKAPVARKPVGSVPSSPQRPAARKSLPSSQSQMLPFPSIDTRRNSLGFVPKYPSSPHLNLPTELMPSVPTPISVCVDLPQLYPVSHQRFFAEQLTEDDLESPAEIWSLTCLLQWMYSLLLANGGDLRMEDMKKALVKLFVYRINKLDLSLAQDIARDALQSLQQQGCISESQPHLVINADNRTPQGVLTLLCNDGCYTNSTSNSVIPRGTGCYSSRCNQESRRTFIDAWSLSSLLTWLYNYALSQQVPVSKDCACKALSRLINEKNTHLDTKSTLSLAREVVQTLQDESYISGDDLALHINTAMMIDNPPTGVLNLLRKDNNEKQLGASDQSAYHLSIYNDQQRQTVPVLEMPLLPPIELGPTIHPGEMKTSTDIIESRPSNQEICRKSVRALEMNWRKFWFFEKSDITSVNPREIELQFAIHELIMSEVLFVKDLETLLDVYGDLKLMSRYPIMDQQQDFVFSVFGRVEKVLQTNKRMLGQLLERQVRQGPYISDVGDIIIEWATADDTNEAYEHYANDFLKTELHLRKELSQNERTQRWMEERGKDPKLEGKPHTFFFHRVLPRLARYQLLLNRILSHTPNVRSTGPSAVDNTQYQSVSNAIDACNVLTQRCDDCVDKQKRVTDVQNLKAHIVFKHSVQTDLELTDRRRRLVKQGDVQRRGELKMDRVSNHVLLLDNYMVLSKKKEGQQGTVFYVSRPPIPMDLLVIENGTDEGVAKVSSRLAITILSNDEPEQTDVEDENSMYPLSITHLGSSGHKYVLYLPTKAERQQWIEAIVEIKQGRALLAFTSSSEPFSMRLVTDVFAYPENEVPHLPIPIANTATYRALCDSSGAVAAHTRIMLRRKVNCFVQVQACYLMGTDHGLWFFNTLDDRPWSEILSTPQRVLRLQVLEMMNAVFLMCGDRNLMWFPLDQLIARGLGDRHKSYGMRLNKQKRIVDFSVATYKNTVVVIYQQQNGILKVIEPLYSYGAVGMRNLTSVGIRPASRCIDSFRTLDRLETSGEVQRVDVFTNSLVLATSKWFEWVSLDTKAPRKIPASTVAAFTKEMSTWGKPLRVFRINDNRLLLCYEACYVACDKHGKVPLQPTTWFRDRHVEVAYVAPYLVLLSHSSEMVEIVATDTVPGRSVQVITGKDICFLSTLPTSVTIRMAQPWVPGRQAVLQIKPRALP